MVIRDPAAIALLCGHNPPRDGCHLCFLAGRRVFADCDDTPPAAEIHPGMCACRLAAIIDGPPRDWPDGWWDWPVSRKAHQQRADRFLADLPPYPAGKHEGRGVVIAAGGKYLPSAYVTIRMLRAVGCAMPIQVWFLGEGERDERYEALLPDVQFVDIAQHPARAARRIVNGFESKLFAVMNSPFEEVLFLDADCYPCAPVDGLFNDAQYRQVGGIYWPDMPEADAWTRWDFWGVARSGPACGFETGQMVLHKRVAWRQLKLAEWYDDHSDWSYRGDYGDKGPHRVAWALAGVSPVVFRDVAEWQHPAFLHRDREGRPQFVHRCRSKFTMDRADVFYTPQSGPNQRGGLPMEDAALGFLDDLRRALA